MGLTRAFKLLLLCTSLWPSISMAKRAGETRVGPANAGGSKVEAARPVRETSQTAVTDSDPVALQTLRGPTAHEARGLPGKPASDERQRTPLRAGAATERDVSASEHAGTKKVQRIALDKTKSQRVALDDSNRIHLDLARLPPNLRDALAGGDRLVALVSGADANLRSVADEASQIAERLKAAVPELAALDEGQQQIVRGATERTVKSLKALDGLSFEGREPGELATLRRTASDLNHFLEASGQDPLDVSVTKSDKRQTLQVKGGLPTKIATPKGQLPGDQLTINSLMDLIQGSAGYKDYLRKLTTTYKIDSVGSFYAIHGDQTVKPDNPQVFVQIGKATVAIAPQMYTEVFWSAGEETIHFQVVETEGGKLTLNAFTFDKNTGKTAAPMTPAPRHEITPAQVKLMHTADLIKKTNQYAATGCLKCHLNTRRRMVEPDNHPRRLNADPNWRFRDKAEEEVVRQKLDGMFESFANGKAKDNPLYRFFWEQPDVVKRGGKIMPNDTFQYDEFIHSMININGHEMLGELKRHPLWNESKDAFTASVADSANVDATLNKLGYTEAALKTERARVATMHAEVNLNHIRNRNNESVAWILAEGLHDAVPQHAKNDALLLNKHAIEAIGPEILHMLVSESEWTELTDDQKKVKVRLSDLDVKSLDELTRIVSSPRVIAQTRKRTNTYLVLEHMFNNRNKALAFLSASVRALSAETGREGADLLDTYNEALQHPRSSPINQPSAAANERE